MKAVIYREPGGPEVLEYIDLPDPAPGAGEILIRVKAISIEGGELATRRLRAPEPSFPVLGNAAAGEVVSLGSGVSGFRVGQKVATFGFSGSYAELRAVAAATSWVVPDGLDMRTAAVIPCGPGTAALALHLAGLRAGETVLVQGATGGVGSAVVQLAARAGAQVIGTGTNAATLDLLRPLGLTHPIVAGDAPVGERVRQILDGRGADVCIDMVGGPALASGLEALEAGGRGVIVGIKGSGVDTVDGALLLSQRLTVRGCFLGIVIAEPMVHELIATLFQSAVRGEIDVPLDQIFSLSQAAEAHARAEQRGNIGRVIMEP